MAVPIAIQKALAFLRWNHVLMLKTRLVAGMVELASSRYSLAITAKNEWIAVEAGEPAPFQTVNRSITRRLSVERLSRVV